MKKELSFFRKALPKSKVYLARNELCCPIYASSLDDHTDLFDDSYCRIVFDSSDVREGDGFVALRGAVHDGHAFLEEVLEKGANLLILAKSEQALFQKIDKKKIETKIILFVDDTLSALKDLAKAWRARFTYPVIGITGSVGKTTTKEMLRTILSQTSLPSYVSYKNQNTEIGLSVNILRMTEQHKVAVFELGINDKGEMEQLVDILHPTMALVTTVSHSHVKGLGTLREIAIEKMKIFSRFNADYIGIICGDIPYLTEASHEHPVVQFGAKIRNHVQARKIKTETINGSYVTTFTLKLYEHKFRVQLSTNHRGMVNNAVAASTIAYFLGISFDTIIKGIQAFNGFESRFEQLQMPNGKGLVISDCYNASPESMRAAITALDELPNESAKVVILGDMLELGPREIAWHKHVGRLVAKAKNIESILLVGDRAKTMAEVLPLRKDIRFAADWHEAVVKSRDIAKEKARPAIFLVKASSGMGLQNVVESLLAE
jgi:UDP-N-acetylmuramoyl-tripeptide--D-alanyl-D-alanine ligase